MRFTIDGSFNIDEEHEEKAVEAIETLLELEQKSDRREEIKYVSPSPEKWRESNNS